ncbi:MAG: DinB family protein [Gemmatimonadota bacterium]
MTRATGTTANGSRWAFWSWITVGVALLGTGPGLSAQAITGEQTSNRDFLLPVADEVALALSAAPSDISSAASLYLLGSEGYERVTTGTNGFACLVLRSFSGAPGSKPTDGPEAQVPACFNGAAAASLVRHAVLASRMHASGADPEAITTEVLSQLAGGTIRPPAGMAFAFMRSAEQQSAGAPATPAMYLYHPFATDEELGEDAGALLSMPGSPAAAIRIPMDPIAPHRDVMVDGSLLPLDEDERRALLREARTGEERLLRRLSSLSDAEWTTRPAAGEWSVAETLEHIASAEVGMVGQVSSMIARARDTNGDGGFRTGLHDAEARVVLLDRGTRFQTAPVMVPNGRYGDPEGALTAFKEARRVFEDLIHQLDPIARTIGFRHPAFAEQLDGYQYLLQATGHVDRHREQIEETLRRIADTETASGS